jgi:glutathione peroxidase
MVAVPSNDFGGQEPGGPAEINKTAHDEYGVRFPLAAKADVKGTAAHPFYKWAALERPGEGPRWNFHKYLIGKDGRIAAVFSTEIEPTDPRMVVAIEKQLLQQDATSFSPATIGPMVPVTVFRSALTGERQSSKMRSPGGIL